MKLYLFNSILAMICIAAANGQCPPNIGFEEGTFNRWSCYTGWIDSVDGVNVTNYPPIDGRHTMLRKSNKTELDFYGRFPVICPNGSGHSVKIGNNSVGAEAEGLSYTYTIPAGQDVFSLVYNYAVVFQDPGHLPHEQPRFTAKVFDVTNSQYITCSSFDFAASGDLPGFLNGSGDVLYKPWSPVTIKLTGYAGKTIRLEFTTNDCTKGGHFGYAYLDIDDNCTSPIQGNIICLSSNSVNLVAPFGYKEYRWYDSGFNTVIGNTNSINISPAPSPGTKYSLLVFPYPGSGCIDTLHTVITMVQVPLNFSLAAFVETCTPSTINLEDIKLRAGSSNGLTYTYFTDPGLTDYVLNPSAVNRTGVYYIQAANVYGCKESRSINAVLHEQPKFGVISPVRGYWPNTIDITSRSLLTGNLEGLNLSYWKDKFATVGLNNPTKIETSGTYFIRATDTFGCSSIKDLEVSLTPPPPPNAFTPNNDGINDTWQIKGLGSYVHCTVDVYNRWGQHMFHSSGYKKPWDGTRNGHVLPVDSYYYVIYLSKEVGSIKGTVTLIR